MKNRTNAQLLASVFAMTLFIGFALGCDNKRPAEQAGKKIDNGVQDVKDAVNPPGPLQKAGRAVDKAVDDK